MQNLDWGSLGFSYTKTNYNVRVVYRDGAWGEIEVSDSEYIPMHIAASCLHYSQEAFEGLKAYRGVDGKVRMFRVEENGKRLQRSAEYLCMAVPPIELFVEACRKVVEMNMDFMPPYGSGATLYLRPLLIGTSPQLGVGPTKEYTLIVFASPVGPYFKSGFKPITVMIDRDHDRAAPKGTGHVKAGGNYAASIYSGVQAHDKGFANVIYLDAAERKYIEECSAANFFGIKDGLYVTPKSGSILPSITNKCLRELAAHLGLVVEERPVPIEELSTFAEVGACGTAAVISPIGKIVDMQTGDIYNYGSEVGEWSMKLYNALQDIQYGRAEDVFGWTREIDVE